MGWKQVSTHQSISESTNYCETITRLKMA